MDEAPSGPGRREARERAVELLYERETKAMSAAEILEALPLRPDSYACAAVNGVEAESSRIDELIERHSRDWTVDRLPLVDRAILRLAVWELCSRATVPTAVVLNEAIDLAHEYSTEKSPAFINGVLASVADEVRS